MINPVLEEVKPYYDMEKSVVVLNINTVGAKQEIRASLIYKDDFRWYLADKKDKLFGFTKYQDVLVLVFGNSAKKYYQLTKQEKCFDFLKISKEKENLTIGGIPVEPKIFEPIVWVYSVDNADAFKLVEMEAGLTLLN